MPKSLSKIWIAITGIRRMYFGINSLVVITICIILIYRYVLKDNVAAILQAISVKYDPNSVWFALGVSVLAGLISTVLYTAYGMLFLSWYSRIRLAGNYKAFDLTKGERAEWGKVTIKYYPMAGVTQHTQVKLRLEHGDIILDGDGIVIDNRYMAGYYTETGQPERRRSGSFMYTLVGSGNAWEGEFVYIDPDNDVPKIGKGRWERV